MTFGEYYEEVPISLILPQIEKAGATDLDFELSKLLAFWNDIFVLIKISTFSYLFYHCKNIILLEIFGKILIFHLSAQNWISNDVEIFFVFCKMDILLLSNPSMYILLYSLTDLYPTEGFFTEN